MVVAVSRSLGDCDDPSCDGPPERAYRATDFHLGVLFELGLDAVVVADLDSGCIVLWNPAAERLFGYSAAEAVGQPIALLMDEGIGHVHNAGLERYRRSGHGLIIDAGKPVELPARHRSGRCIRVELSLSPVVCKRAGTFVLGILRDAVDRRPIELAAGRARARRRR
jgi:two-component system sensor kinase FixL